MTLQQIQTVKSTVPALAEHGVAITPLFYKNLLSAYPEHRNLFNVTHQLTGEQPAALAHAVWAYASNIEDPSALKATISRIGHKHASLGVTPEQYDIVGETLLQAIKKILGPAATEPMLDAWKAAYSQLARYFIDFEDGLYKHAQTIRGGWRGWRKFFVSSKVQEGEEIVSFHLAPVDGLAPPAYQPGQFVSVRCYVPQLKAYQPRQHSLSDVPKRDYFQISVKREPGTHILPAGRVSNVLHEALPIGSELDVSMPFGNFVLDLDASTPVVLLSGGVGLTPMMAMLRTVTDGARARTVVFAHATRNGRVHAMKPALEDLVAKNKRVSRAVFYEEVAASDKRGVDYDFVGRVDLRKIKDMILLPEADYYICGPQPFMKEQSASLQNMGIPLGRIHMEVFGAPSEERRENSSTYIRNYHDGIHLFSLCAQWRSPRGQL